MEKNLCKIGLRIVSALLIAISLFLIISTISLCFDNTLHKANCYDRYGSTIEGITCVYKNSDIAFKSLPLMVLASGILIFGAISVWKFGNDVERRYY